MIPQPTGMIGIGRLGVLVEGVRQCKVKEHTGRIERHEPIPTAEVVIDDLCRNLMQAIVMELTADE